MHTTPDTTTEITPATVAALIAATIEDSATLDAVSEALRALDGKMITTRFADKMPAPPAGHVWRINRRYGWTSLDLINQTGTHDPQPIAGFGSVSFILIRTEASAPFVWTDFEPGNIAYYDARRERNAARAAALDRPYILDRAADAMTRITAARAALDAARADLDTVIGYGEPLHASAYELRAACAYDDPKRR